MDNRISQRAFSAQSLIFFRSCVFLLLMTLCLGATTQAQIYKWVDENGNAHYSQLPPEQGQASGAIETIPLSQRYTPSREASTTQPQVANQVASSMPAADQEEATVELFTTSWCGYCKKARAFLNARGVRFVEYDIEKDPAAARRKQEIDNRPGVPLALMNGQVIHGFSPYAYTQALR